MQVRFIEANRVIKALMFVTVFLLVACSGPSKKTMVKPVVVEPIQASPVLTPEHMAQYNAGIEAMKTKRYTQAEMTFNNLLNIYPRLAGAYVNLALVAEARSDTELAIANYEKALQINPNNVDALIQRAHGHRGNGRFEAAVQDLRLAEAVDSANPLIHFNLGVIYELYLQDYGLAIEHYENYVRLSTDEDVAIVKRWIKLLERK